MESAALVTFAQDAPLLDATRVAPQAAHKDANGVPPVAPLTLTVAAAGVALRHAVDGGPRVA